MQYARCSKMKLKRKGQMKIQEMAFVLVAMMIFFGLVSLIFVSINLSQLKKDTTLLREQDAQELIRKISGIPELSFSGSKQGCSNCIDVDKALILKDQKVYQGFFNIGYLMIERVFPTPENGGECTVGNYPDCRTITLINSSSFISAPYAYVSLCRFEGSGGGYMKCELGRVHSAGKGISS